MTTVAVVQARMGSSRLPGKMMFPLSCRPVVEHIIERTRRSTRLDDIVLATTESAQDDVLAQRANRLGVTVYRGDEHDVLGRIYRAAEAANAGEVVRICADTPLLSPTVIDTVVQSRGDADYASTTLERTFPRGLDVEAFSMASFADVNERATEPHQREHVTPFYREHGDEFTLTSVRSQDVFDDERLRDRTDLRLTLDEADDYRLFEQVYEGIEFADYLPFGEAVAYIDDRSLGMINDHVRQQSVDESERGG